MKKKSTFIINTKDVPLEGREYSFPVENQWIMENLLDFDIHQPVSGGKALIMVNPVGSKYYIKGNVNLSFSMTCVRCLREVPITLNVPISIIMIKWGEGETVSSFRCDEVGIGRFTGNEIVLDEEIREAIILELPMNPTCSSGCSIEDLYREEL